MKIPTDNPTPQASASVPARSLEAELYATLAVGIVNPKVRRIAALVETAEAAADWLCECSPGSDQHQRGVMLRIALDYLKNPSK